MEPMHNVEQRSEDWFQARVGKLTASRMAAATARTKSGAWGADRTNYMAELAVERLTGTPTNGFTSAAMQWGIDTEPEARIAYEFYHDAEVVEVGFVDHSGISMSGASPDGLVGDDGMVEIKCPNSATHIDTLLGTPVADKYVKQMQWQMDCTGRDWCDFVSYDPRMPEHLKLYVHRFHRDEEMIAQLRKDAQTFLNELADKVARLEQLTEAA